MIDKKAIIEQVLIFLDSDNPSKDISEYLEDELNVIERKMENKVDHYREVGKIVGLHFDLCFYSEDVLAGDSDLVKTIETDMYKIFVKEAEPAESKKVYCYSFEVQ